MTLLFTQRVPGKEKEFFAQQMALMLSSGLTLPRALDVIYRQTRNAYFQKILAGVARSLQNGRQLSQALANYPRIFPYDYTAVLRAGESTGRLDKVFKDLALKQKEENIYKSGLLNALLYPVMIVIAIIAISIYLVFAVIPNIAQLFSDQNITLPWSTRTLIATVGFFNSYWYIVLLVVVGLVFAANYYAKTKNGRLLLSQAQLRLPVFKDLYEAVYVSEFSRTLSMLVRHGVPIIEATRITKETMRNVLYRSACDQMISDLEKGIPLSKPILDNKIFPPLLGQMVLVGEQTGKLDDALSSVADDYHRQANVIIKNLSALVEPILIVLVGFGVAFIVFAILLPIYQIAQIG